MPEESLFVQTPEQALQVWAEYHRTGVVKQEGRVGPRRLDNIAPLKGLEIPHGVALYVEDTPGFQEVERELRLTYGLAVRRVGLAFCEYPRVTIERFRERLAEKLPLEFWGPHEEMCEADLEAAFLSQSRASLADIDEKYRARYPGMMREGFGRGWNADNCGVGRKKHKQ